MVSPSAVTQLVVHDPPGSVRSNPNDTGQSPEVDLGAGNGGGAVLGAALQDLEIRDLADINGQPRPISGGALRIDRRAGRRGQEEDREEGCTKHAPILDHLWALSRPEMGVTSQYAWPVALPIAG